jgi:hypothetical protein
MILYEECSNNAVKHKLIGKAQNTVTGMRDSIFLKHIFEIKINLKNLRFRVFTSKLVLVIAWCGNYRYNLGFCFLVIVPV